MEEKTFFIKNFYFILTKFQLQVLPRNVNFKTLIIKTLSFLS